MAELLIAYVATMEHESKLLTSTQCQLVLSLLHFIQQDLHTVLAKAHATH